MGVISVISEKGIVVDELSLGYGKRQVLDRISLRLSGGKVTTLVGPNGCGKTTLLKALNGIIKPDSGKVLVDGDEVAKSSPSSLARVMGYVPQSQRSSFPFSSLEIVLTGRMPHISTFSTPKRDDIEIAHQSLSLVGADHLADRPYTQISGGERQLVMIARAMAQKPSVLLLDEPTSYLDFKNQISTLKMVKDISKRKAMTVIMTLHDPNHALMFSDQVVLLRSPGRQDADGCMPSSDLGHVVASGEPRMVLTPQNIKIAYGMDVEILRHNGHYLLIPV